MTPENQIKINTDAVKSAKKMRGKPFEKGYDSRRNLQGRPEGRRSFTTLFKEAIEKIAKERKLPIEDPEVELVVRAIVEALKGNYQYYKDIMDRLYGKPKETHEIYRNEDEIEAIKRIEGAIQKILTQKVKNKNRILVDKEI